VKAGRRLSLSTVWGCLLPYAAVVENPTAGVRLRTGRITNWRNGQMVLRSAAAAYLDAEKAFKRIMGYRDPWILKAALDEDQQTQELRVA